MRLGVAVVLVVGLLFGGTAWASPTRELALLRADGVRVEFEVEVASSEAQRREGLMARASLPPRHGMLFDFRGPTVATMWMKDTSLSLDMLFLDEQGRVVWIAADTTPGSLALISASQPVRYVLELRGGETRALGIAVGDRALLPFRTRAPAAARRPGP